MLRARACVRRCVIFGRLSEHCAFVQLRVHFHAHPSRKGSGTQDQRTCAFCSSLRFHELRTSLDVGARVSDVPVPVPFAPLPAGCLAVGNMPSATSTCTTGVGFDVMDDTQRFTGSLAFVSVYSTASLPLGHFGCLISACYPGTCATGANGPARACPCTLRTSARAQVGRGWDVASEGAHVPPPPQTIAVKWSSFVFPSICARAHTRSCTIPLPFDCWTPHTGATPLFRWSNTITYSGPTLTLLDDYSGISLAVQGTEPVVTGCSPSVTPSVTKSTSRSRCAFA
jgi:hypothetical protein